MKFKRVERVKISDVLLMELDRKWSRPVEIMVKGRDEDGDLELLVRVAEESLGDKRKDVTR